MNKQEALKLAEKPETGNINELTDAIDTLNALWDELSEAEKQAAYRLDDAKTNLSHEADVQYEQDNEPDTLEDRINA